MLDYYCVVGEKVRMGFVCLLTVPDYTCNCVIAADEALNYHSAVPPWAGLAMALRRAPSRVAPEEGSCRPPHTTGVLQ